MKKEDLSQQTHYFFQADFVLLFVMSGYFRNEVLFFIMCFPKALEVGSSVDENKNTHFKEFKAFSVLEYRLCDILMISFPAHRYTHLYTEITMQIKESRQFQVSWLNG